MSILLITYDLHKPGQDYTDLLAKIKSGGNWARLSESSYAVRTAYSPEQVYNQLKPYLDANDNLYVITLTRPYYGQGPTDVNSWLAQNL
jgi:hypothetical protein